VGVAVSLDAEIHLYASGIARHADHDAAITAYEALRLSDSSPTLLEDFDGFLLFICEFHSCLLVCLVLVLILPFWIVLFLSFERGIDCHAFSVVQSPVVAFLAFAVFRVVSWLSPNNEKARERPGLVVAGDCK
tara:strand:+ start:520 stop:918 length:399 start_codon:yes stop_codon:yes gene_type:complete